MQLSLILCLFPQTCFILAVENVGKAYRTLSGVIIEFFFVAGEALLALVAWQTRDWRQTLLYVTVPLAAFLLYWPFLPESIRWQINHGRMFAAQRTADRIAGCNSRQKIDIRNYTIPTSNTASRGTDDDDK